MKKSGEFLVYYSLAKTAGATQRTQKNTQQMAAELAAVHGELAAVRSEQQKVASRAERERNLRDFILEEESKLHHMAKWLTRAPGAVLLAALMVRQAFQNNEAEPSAFEQFVDKDRTRTALSLLAQTIDAAESAATEDERRKAYSIIERMPHLETADKLIQLHEVRQHQARKHAELVDLRAHYASRNSAITCIAIIPSLCTFGGSLLLLFARAKVPSKSQIALAAAALRDTTELLREWSKDFDGNVSVAGLQAFKEQFEDEIRSILIIDRNAEPIVPPLL